MILEVSALFRKGQTEPYTVPEGSDIVLLVDEQSKFIKGDKVFNGGRMLKIKPPDGPEQSIIQSSLRSYSEGTTITDVLQRFGEGVLANQPPLSYIRVRADRVYEDRFARMLEIVNQSSDDTAKKTADRLLAAGAIEQLQEQIGATVLTKAEQRFADTFRSLESRIAAIESRLNSGSGGGGPALLR